MEFRGFNKIPRLFRPVTITEKINGTNGAIVVETPSQALATGDLSALPATQVVIGGEPYYVGAQSRKRIITPAQDNHGFARWVWEHATELAGQLGLGTHFGEWWGSGIQGGYGLKNGEKRFSLFNTFRWPQDMPFETDGLLHVVPVLYQGGFADHEIEFALDRLAMDGSVASPGFMDPEGIIIYHDAARAYFKITLKNDAAPKGVSGA